MKQRMTYSESHTSRAEEYGGSPGKDSARSMLIGRWSLDDWSDWPVGTIGGPRAMDLNIDPLDLDLDSWSEDSY